MTTNPETRLDHLEQYSLATRMMELADRISKFLSEYRAWIDPCILAEISDIEFRLRAYAELFFDPQIIDYLKAEIHSASKLFRTVRLSVRSAKTAALTAGETS